MDQVVRLFHACEHGDSDEVDKIITSGVAVDTTIDDGYTPLQIASANGHEHVVRLLLRKGASLDKTNEFGWTAIMQAARYNQLKIISLLLQNNADLHTQNKLFASALNIAARAGHLSTVSLLVEFGIDLNGNGTHCENTPLMSAAQYGHDAVVRYLLDRGCDVDYRNPNTGLNALMLTALNGHMTTAQILVERGADPNLTNANDRTALEIAIARRKREVRDYLDRKTTKRPHLEPEEVKSDIIEAAKTGDLSRMIEILEEEPEEKDAVSPEDGATPLMLAAINGRLDIVQLLVERQCDINKRDRISGWTALMQATFHGKKQVAVFLVNIGADVSIQANNGCTAFEMASMIDDIDTELLRLLAARQVNGPRPDKKRWRPKSGASGAIVPENLDELPRGSLKMWWKRTSNRFRNLKLGRTFNFQSGRLSPVVQETGSLAALKGTLKSRFMGSTASMPDITRTSSSIASTGTYETMLLTEGPARLAMGMTTSQSNSALTGTDTLKPVIPPFPPPATFDIADQSGKKARKPYKTRFALDDEDFDDHMTNHKRSVKLFSTAYTNTSPNNSHGGSSPGSSGGASSVHTTFQCINKIPKSTSDNMKYKRRVQIGVDHSSSSPFRAHAPRELIFETVNPTRHTRSSTANNKHPMMPIRTTPDSGHDSGSPNSSISSGSMKSHKRSTSTMSTTSTLTPSPSPGPQAEDDDNSTDVLSEDSSDSIIGTVNKLHETEDDELRNVLKRLALEKYQPIFEEQEVDMEAFLTLTDQDLKELGITRREPRRKILSAIDEITSGRSSSSDMDAGMMEKDSRTFSEPNLASSSKPRRAWEGAG